METAENIISLCRAFGIDAGTHSATAIKNGLINTTYLIEIGDGSKYLLQKINTGVFTKPVELMENIVNVTEFLRKKIAMNGGNPERETLSFLPTEAGGYCHRDGDGGYWRMYHYVDEALTHDSIESNEMFAEAGRAFGNFRSLLSDYPMESLHETIPSFHDTKIRFANLKKAIDDNKANRLSGIEREVEFALAREADASRLVGLLSDGKLKLSVTHNDTKLNNVLFDTNTGNAFCVIDLDTVMPGLSLYDFGDAIRFGANTTAEDDPVLDNVSVSLPLYESFTRGYISGAGEMTENEASNLAFAAKLMSYECGIRFLSDYLDGDTYFGRKYETHNLVRARNQFALVADMEKHMAELEAITARVISEQRLSNEMRRAD